MSRRGRMAWGEDLPSEDKVPKAPKHPENWFNPTVPPYSMENLSDRFVDTVPSYLNASVILASLLPDFGITAALVAIIKPHIEAVRMMFYAKDVAGLGNYNFHTKGRLGELSGVNVPLENEALSDVEFEIIFRSKLGSLWGDVGYVVSGGRKVIALEYNTYIPWEIIKDHPEWEDRFVYDLNRFDISIRHEVTHAVRDSQTHHLEKFIKRMHDNPKVFREYSEHGHKDLDFEVDAIINSFETLRDKIGQRRYDELNEGWFERLLPGLIFPRTGDPARRVWMMRMVREGLLPEKMKRGRMIGMALRVLASLKLATVYYHVTPTKNISHIRWNGIRAPAYIWDNLKMATWFKKLHEDKEYSDDSQPMTILVINAAGLPKVADNETKDMNYWSSQFPKGMNGGGWIVKDGIDPERVL